MQEKRKYRRFYFTGKVELKTKDGKTTRGLSVHLDNLSLGGIRVRSQERIEVDKDVDITITTPLLSRPLRGKGKVKYVNTVSVYGAGFFAMGVHFTHINHKQVKHLIDKTLGWGEERVIPQPFRKELAFVLKALLIIIPIMWILFKVAEYSFDYSVRGQQDKGVGEALIRAVDYFLSRR